MKIVYSILTLVNKKILLKLFLFLIIFNINFIEIDKIECSFINRCYCTVIFVYLCIRWWAIYQLFFIPLNFYFKIYKII